MQIIFRSRILIGMKILDRIKLSAKYGKAIFIISSLYSLGAAAVCLVYPTLAPSCIILKLLFIPVVLYLYKSFQDKNRIYFYLNLGISRTEYYAIPVAVEFLFFAALLTISIILSHVVG